MLLLIAVAVPAANAQQTPPYCQGANRSLQFSAAGWVCATVAAGMAGPQGPKGDPGPQGVPGPQGPAWTLPPSPPSNQCITAKWDGTAWVCVPTNYLDAR